ncbi:MULTISPECIES: GIY-YIG nuclease family protein [unclassified Leptolyngbya]|uniref:GIY-YIG nuclease family protein n=1 Tax=unclassified Leptolyngbya TaxID=2650499 RepID=UPI0016823A2C|nr:MULTISPECIES: GIY-YIG nuclease family protein [unclassified Leptolyngbya]MBD1912142.1 GIY-YIG nuclease family protein [Leptolyngbya sp. FACHB-8]MBD2155033.1 GIY-YIG nuclease family protein [Leptolyngbya sp. FACHB-16]
MTPLSQLDFQPYLTEQGQIAPDLEGKIGVYAIFDANQVLQFVGYSRDVALSLRQHLVRQPDHCYWLKVEMCDRPNRTLLEETRTAWITENGTTPAGNSTDTDVWNQPIDVRPWLTSEEVTACAQAEELERAKLLKTAARRAEAEVLARLEARGVTIPLRFDPKLKDVGQLNLKA